MIKKETPQERYKKKYIKQYKFECNVKTEEDIITFIESKKNKSGYIKKLILKDIENEKNTKI